MITITFPFSSTSLVNGPTTQTKIESGPLLPAELALDPATGDLAIPVRILRGPEATVQRVKSRFRFFLGEWYLDTRLGVPYFQVILVKNPDPALVSFVFRRVLITTPGVKSVKTFTARLDRPTRKLFADFLAILNDGSIITAANEPFIITP